MDRVLLKLGLICCKINQLFLLVAKMLEKITYLSPISSIAVRTGRPIVIKTATHFSVPTMPRYFYLFNGPCWLVINRQTGVITGTAPTVRHDVQFCITVCATIQGDMATGSFFIKVLAEDMLEDLKKPILILSMRNKPFFPREHLPTTHDILAYIFGYFDSVPEGEQFRAKIREAANEHHVALSNKLTYEDFKKVMEAVNPEIESQLEAHLGKEHFIILAELNTVEFRNLFREGSQPLGVHAIAVWNHLAAPDLQLWSAVDTILNAAAHAIIHLRQDNQLHELMLPYQHLFPHP